MTCKFGGRGAAAPMLGLFALLWIGDGRLAGAEELTVALQCLGAGQSSPFEPQLLIQVTNESFASVNLLEKMQSSELQIDGKPFKRLAESFLGPAGLSPKASWQGCIPLEDYAPEELAAGRHRLRLKIGGAASEEIRVKIPRRVPPAPATKGRLRQAEALQELITPGLRRSCVDHWLPERDGGFQSGGSIRYYLDPGVKVIVPYEETPPEPRVNGGIRLYPESRLLD